MIEKMKNILIKKICILNQTDPDLCLFGLGSVLARLYCKIRYDHP